MIRDKSSRYNVNVPPNHIPKSPKELVPWMEGARVAELMKYANVKVIPATGVVIKKINGTWYGPDEKGNYIFEVDPSKAGPPFSKKINENTAIEIDTHGMNVMVPTAIKEHAFLVIACGDLIGKAKAEMYMAKRGINCYAVCDRYTPYCLGYQGPGVILGGAPIRPIKEGAIIGAQPVYINTKELIVAQTTHVAYPYQYCDTPARFFNMLQKKYGIKLNVKIVDSTNAVKVVEEAEKTGANVIGVRVVTYQDKKAVEKWLKENPNHRAILFHSAAYEPGYKLFFEFPQQVTGQDPRPIFVKDIPIEELQKKLEEIRKLWTT